MPSIVPLFVSGRYLSRIFTFAGLDAATFVAPRVCRHWAKWLLTRPQPHLWRALVLSDPRVADEAVALHELHVKAKRAAEQPGGADAVAAARRRLEQHPSPYDFTGALALAAASRDAAWAVMPDLTTGGGLGVTLRWR